MFAPPYDRPRAASFAAGSNGDNIIMISLFQATKRTLSTRRLVLLATVTNLAVAVLVVGSGNVRNSVLPAISAAYAAEGVQRPAGFADLADKVRPSVISVRVKMSAKSIGMDDSMPSLPDNSQLEHFFRRFGIPGDENAMPNLPRAPRNRAMTGQGSGFFISADGFAVTNNHVVDKADTVEISTDDGKTYQAKVVGTDPRSDVALIKVDGLNDFPYVHFADHAPRVGDWVLAVGNPFGLGGTVTAGIVSARGRDIGAGPYDDFIQIDAPVNKGNSGGPTFDVDGNVIGVNTAIVSPSGGSVGIAFAIPADTIKDIVAQLKDKGSVVRGWIGVQIQPVTAEIAEGLGLKTAQGALVAEPQAGGPAAKAGIMSGDVVTAVDGTAVKDARDLAKRIGQLAPGATVKLTVWRKGEEKSYSLTLGMLPNQREAGAGARDANPAATNLPRLGLTLAPAGQVAGSGTDGVVVTSVDPNGIASEHGLKIGDVILEVSSKKVANPGDVRDALGQAQKDGKRAVLMRLKSTEGSRFVAVRIARA
jgi:serine protease Do